MSLLRPVLWARDGEIVKQIRHAETAKDVLDLVPLALGLGEPEWYNCLASCPWLATLAPCCPL
jgi:hypothetical protein